MLAFSKVKIGMKFYRKNCTKGVEVSNKQDIIACMGELAYSIQSIEIIERGVVIGYIGGQGVTLGFLKDE